MKRSLRAGLMFGGPALRPRERMPSLLRFSHAGTNEASALPALNPDFLYAAQDATAYAAFVKKSRKKRACSRINAAPTTNIWPSLTFSPTRGTQRVDCSQGTPHQGCSQSRA